MPERKFEEIPLSSTKEGDPNEVLEELPDSDAVVVLGEWLKESKSGEIVPSLESKMRALGALELLMRGKAKKIIVAGGVVDGPPGSPAISEAIKKFLIEKGVPEELIIAEAESKNTSENLENILKILEKENLKKVILETSEYHLDRAEQLWRNILEKRGLKIESAFISAEKMLMARSPHYKKITSAYTFPESLRNAPAAALKKGLREFLRRILISIDRDDKVAKFLVNKFRGPKDKEQELR